MKNAMFKHSNYLYALLISLISLISMTSIDAHAAATKIEIFDAKSWQRLQKELPRPSVVVFSTTDCGHCPAIIAALAEQITQRKTAIPLLVVVMDGEGQNGLLQEPHYQPASRLFIFKGQTAALQYGINPHWRGITPYVALMAHTGAPKLVLGKPSEQEIKNWLGVAQTSNQ